MQVDIEGFEWAYDPGGYRWKEARTPDGTEPNLFLVPKRETVFRGKNGKEMAGFVPFPLWDKSVCRTYSVLDKKILYRRFADTPPTKDGIIQFANSFGELGGGETALLMIKRPQKGDPSTSVAFHGPTVIFAEADSFTTWCNEIEAMQLAYRCWKACRLDDEKEIADVTKEIDAFSLSSFPGDNKWTPLSPASNGNGWTIRSPAPNGKTQPTIPRGLNGKAGLLEALAHLCNEGMRGRYSVVLRNQPVKPNPVPYLQPNSLIGALWYQFSETIGNERWRVCEYCGEPTEGSRSKKYCSNSHRTMASQRRKKRLGKPAGDKKYS